MAILTVLIVPAATHPAIALAISLIAAAIAAATTATHSRHPRRRRNRYLCRGRLENGDETSFYPFAYPKKCAFKRGK